MIGRLSGILIEKQPPQLMIDVGGVGYELLAPMTTFYNLPALQEPVTLYTQLIVREDAHQLYGFEQPLDKQLFCALIKANGVGPKSALSILSSFSSQALIQALTQNNLAQLTRVPGIGKKTAERLLIDMQSSLKTLQSKLEHLNYHQPAAKTADGSSSAESATSTDTSINTIADTVAALISLGYKPSEAERIIQKINVEDSHTLSREELIRRALSLG